MAYSYYDDYESTLAPWLNIKPTAWEERKLKFCVSLINEKVAAIDFNLDFIGLEHIESWTGKRIFDPYSQSEGIVAKFKFDDILFGKLRPYLAKVHKAEQEGLATTEALILRCNSNIRSDFLKYYLLSSDFIDVVDGSTYGSKMPRANYEFIGNLSLLVPSNEEQTQIAKFLDHKTAQIDRLIAKKKALIEKLNEKRTALITQAVTKGLNPDAPMKDSGVDWLGEVPEHWEVARLRFYIISSPVKSEISYINRDELVSFVPMDAVSEYGGIRLDTNKILDDIYDGYTYFRDNDVVIAKITPCFENGKGALAGNLTNGIAFGTTELHVIRPLAKCSGNWLFYLSVSHAFREIGTSEMIGAGGQKRIPENFIKNFSLGIPSLKEQIQIAEFLDDKTTQIDKLVNKASEAIDTLTEYRTALITAAVTGKIDVRNVSIPEQLASL